MPGTAWPEEMPSWHALSTLPAAVRHTEDAPRVAHPPAVAPSAPSLEEFASDSTLHGISHIFQHGPYTVRNFLWTLAFLGSLAFLVHVYTERVEFYFQYPHATTLEEETLRSMAFPAVTICNLNPLRFSHLSGHDLYWAGQFLGFLDGDDRVIEPESADAEVLKVLSQKLDQSKAERNLPFDFQELHSRAGHQMDQMLVECKFGNESCDASDFETVSLRPFPAALNLNDGNGPLISWKGWGGLLPRLERG
uniref:Uncharacterized protein n=1 Tax=Varanus komodoensis TaxID=61221 RepID=A0A8D2LRG8_VARKO